MDTFPTTVPGPCMEDFRDEPSDEAVLRGSMASGYPLLNKLFTFDPRMFTFSLRFVPDADKVTIMTFYENNKDVPFYWTNDQDSTQYEVAFISKPVCTSEGDKDLWKIDLQFVQTAA